jgi:hypothetical protein
MAYIKTLNRYSAFLYPGKSISEGRINLYCDDHKLYLLFRSDETELPNNSFNASSKTGVAYENLSRFPYYLDLIRNEKPISVTFNPDATPPAYVVYCASEPPGDGEV